MLELPLYSPPYSIDPTRAHRLTTSLILLPISSAIAQVSEKGTLPALVVDGKTYTDSTVSVELDEPVLLPVEKALNYLDPHSLYNNI